MTSDSIPEIAAGQRPPASDFEGRFASRIFEVSSASTMSRSARTKELLMCGIARAEAVRRPPIMLWNGKIDRPFGSLSSDKKRLERIECCALFFEEADGLFRRRIDRRLGFRNLSLRYNSNMLWLRFYSAGARHRSVFPGSRGARSSPKLSTFPLDSGLRRPARPGSRPSSGSRGPRCSRGARTR